MVSCSQSSRTVSGSQAHPGLGNRYASRRGARQLGFEYFFIRRLPMLAAEDIERMDALNPKTPAQFKEEEEVPRSLRGDWNRTTPAP